MSQSPESPNSSPKPDLKDLLVEFTRQNASTVQALEAEIQTFRLQIQDLRLLIEKQQEAMEEMTKSSFEMARTIRGHELRIKNLEERTAPKKKLSFEP
jgi:predicted RNase H-like nuclease (RuvC/YqgF family)